MARARAGRRCSERAPERFLDVAAPVQRRVLAGGFTVHHQVQRSALPAAADVEDDAAGAAAARRAWRGWSASMRRAHAGNLLARMNSDGDRQGVGGAAEGGRAGAADRGASWPSELTPARPAARRGCEWLERTSVAAVRCRWRSPCWSSSSCSCVAPGARGRRRLRPASPRRSGWCVGSRGLAARARADGAAIPRRARRPASTQLPASPDFRLGTPGQDPAPHHRRHRQRRGGTLQGGAAQPLHRRRGRARDPDPGPARRSTCRRSRTTVDRPPAARAHDSDPRARHGPNPAAHLASSWRRTSAR